MRVMLLPSKDQSKEKFQHPEISIEVPDDDLLLSEVILLIKASLIAWGFHPDSVDEYFNQD